jgi:Reverse transcriptase (RNA-dependent DNA polymerase)
MNIDRILAEISLTTGYALSRWKIGIDVMIPKKADSQRVDKLRTIVLMEADFNFLNKLIGKRVMIQAERTNSLADEQYGSRKNLSSILHATNKQLVFDIIRQKKQDVALIVLDAKSCYDRISPPIASLCLRRCGAPQSMCEMMFSAIDEMRHYTRTSFGDSEGWYKRQDQRFHGILQGNGAGPTMWATISSPLLDRLREEGFGVQITNNNTNESVAIPAFAFVDDTDLIQEITNEEDYITQAQNMLNVWDNSLRATGGALVAEKCSWFLLKHRWQNNKWELLSNEESPGALQMQNHDGSLCPLKRYEPNESVSALGLMFSPSGDTGAHLQMLLDKAHRWAEIIKHSGLSRTDVWYSLNTMILKSLEYSMLASTLSQSDLNAVMSCILKVGLSKSGICRTIAREAVYATNKYFGFNINDLYVTQGIRKLRLLLNPQTFTTRHLISTALDLFCAEAGVGINVFESKWYDLIITYTTTGWITSLGKFLFDYNITLHKKDENQLRFQRDDFLMNKAMECGVKGKDLKLFNACRLFLQVILISDIITADGKSIKKHIWTGDKSAHEILGEWPRQPKPDNRGWTVWKYVLRKIFDFRIDNIFLYGVGTVQYPINWMWYYSELDSRVFRKQQDQYQVYSIQRQTTYRSRRNQRRFVLTANEVQFLPEDSRMCTTYDIGNDIMVDGIGGWAFTSAQVRSIDQWTRTINNIIVGEKEEFFQEWRNGTLIMISDGSAKDSVATGAWIITSEEMYRGGKYIEGSALSNGPSHIQDSHRGECIGLLGGLYTITKLLEEWKEDSGSITMGCDNQSSLYYAFDKERYPNIDPTYPDFDILSSIRTLMKPNINYRPKYVKGHQDQFNVHLDIYALLNIRADSVANLRRENTSIQTFCDQPSNIQFPGEIWQVHVGKIKVCRNLPVSLKEFISANTMEQMWSRRKKLSATTFSMVDWEAIQGAMKEIRTPRRHWIIKHALEECGINTVLKKRKEKTDSTCRRCGSEETATHVWQCQDIQVQEIWSRSIASMVSFLDDLNTDPVITNAITTNLLGWYNGTLQLSDNNANPIFGQQSIGWQFLLEGWIGKQWRMQQSQHFLLIKSKKSSLRWTIAVIKKLWDIAWDLWEHRNGVEHMHDTTVAHELLNRQIEDAFENFDEGSGVSYAYMFREEEKLLLQTAGIGYKRAWIRNVNAAQQRAQRRAVSSTELSRMQNVMRRFIMQGNST